MEQNKIMVIAGPCAMESEEQLRITAKAVKKAGATILRAGIFKPRCNPHLWNGERNEKALKLLKEIGNEINLPIITEVTGERCLKLIDKYADILQIGTRNMQNHDLLEYIGQESNTPVLIKRAFHATSQLREFLNAAEFVAKYRKNPDQEIILCLRGVRTTPNDAKCEPDYDQIPELKKLMAKREANYKIIFDASHSAGNGNKDMPREILIKEIIKQAKNALCYGADGIMLEVGINQKKCDEHQHLSLDEFTEFMQYVKKRKFEKKIIQIQN